MELKKDFELVYHPNRRNLMAIPVGFAGILTGCFGLWLLFFLKREEPLSLWAAAGQGIFWLAFLVLGIWCVTLMVRPAKQH